VQYNDTFWDVRENIAVMTVFSVKSGRAFTSQLAEVQVKLGHVITENTASGETSEKCNDNETVIQQHDDEIDFFFKMNKERQ